MAATGGGKIRSRRYHIASKPYAKSKQQSGLISRVTDTVKSIVPSWLQKYFNNEDPPEEGGTVPGTDHNCTPPPPPTPPPNGSEEGPPPLDGRDSPEPSTSNTEPSTSRASLNFQDIVLPRPPLSRSHLQFTPLDASSPQLGASSSLFSQPSTSMAPGPFSTGFSLVKEIKDNLSQHEDDNISTTSGFSSRASDKDVPTSKTASLPQLWSPEMDRTNSGPQPSQSSQKKPSFNLSVFRNSTLNSTLLNSSQLGDSPFYPGKTTYGGAAAVKCYRSRPGTPYQAPLRRQIKAKPASAQPCGVTSATARRILQSLERMSSPLADAKRIPALASPNLSPAGGHLIEDLSYQPSKKKRMDSAPPTQNLVVLAPSSASGNRTVSFRPTLTPGGLSRPMDRRSREKTPTRQSQQLPEATPGPSQSTRSFADPAYPLSSTPAPSSQNAGGGKMKRERNSGRTSSKYPQDDEVAEAPVFPSISLPINTASLPTFSFSPSLPSTTTFTPISTTTTKAVTPVKETATNKDPQKESTPPCVPFTFSSPIVKATATSPPSYSPSTGFMFSDPVAKFAPSMSNGKLSSPTIAVTASKSTGDIEGPFKPAKTLKQGSVLDLLKSPGFASPVAHNSSGTRDAPQQTSTPSTGAISSSIPSVPSSTGFGLFKASTDSIGCDACRVQNKQKCVCVSPKCTEGKTLLSRSLGMEISSANTTTSFTPLFTKPTGTWDCDTCLVVNKPDATKCVACETAKPGTGLKPSLAFPSVFTSAKTASPEPVTTGFSGFADKLKKQDGAQDCEKSLSQNKDTKSLDSTVPKPAEISSAANSAPLIGLGDKFKRPEGSWDCDVCLVQNKASDAKCVACQAAKPGATPETKGMWGIGLVKKPEGSWDCEVCLLQNKASDVKCVACQATKPGATPEPKAFGSFGSSTATSTFNSSNSGGFKFGTTDSTSTSGGFKFGQMDSSSTSSSGGFKFGVPASESSTKDSTAQSGFKFGTTTSDKKSDQPAASSGFKFGDSSGPGFGTGSSNIESNSSKSGFSFGLSNPSEKTTETTTSSSASVTSTTLCSSQNKNDNEDSTNVATSTITSSTTTSTAKGSVFGRLGTRNTIDTSQVSSAFASAQAGNEPAAPTFTFGKPEDKKEDVAAAAPSAFVFGGTGKDPDPSPAQSTSGGFKFGKATAPTEQPPPTFTFGKPTDKAETSISETQKPPFTFGQSASDSSNAPKPTFSFIVNKPIATTSASSTSTPSLFGNGSTPAPSASAAPSTFVFGQPSTGITETAPAKTFVFGQSQEGQTSSSTSAPQNPAPAPAQPFIFGTTNSAAAAPAAAPSFSFGAAAAAAPPAVSSSAPSAVPTSFAFSSAPSGGFGANQTPSFGSTFGSPFTAAPSQTPAFGAKPSASPVFGQQPNSTPVFGGVANSAPAAGFQFGGASGFGATNNASGVFTFGAGDAASPAPSANPSITPQAGATGTGFNFNQAPTFNMGLAKSFTSSPAGPSPISGRKIKTAVRRRK